jgi:hypothetical protein
MIQKRKKKRQTKTEFVLVRMEPDLKTKLIAEAKRRALDVSTLVRMLTKEGLEHEAQRKEDRRRWERIGQRARKSERERRGRNA